MSYSISILSNILIPFIITNTKKYNHYDEGRYEYTQYQPKSNLSMAMFRHHCHQHVKSNKNAEDYKNSSYSINQFYFHILYISFIFNSPDIKRGRRVSISTTLYQNQIGPSRNSIHERSDEEHSYQMKFRNKQDSPGMTLAQINTKDVDLHTALAQG